MGTTSPLILVDMPGFHSPLDLHNRAILEYLNKGIHYIMLISVEDGTITKSMARKLQDITSLGRDISFFLSKTNLRSPEEVNSVREELIEDIEEILDVKKEVISIDDNDGESLNKILKAIDPENIFTSVYKDEIKEKFYSAINIINTLISSLKRDKYENETAIENLSKSLESIVKQRDRLINDIKDKYSGVSINQIVEEVGSDINSSIDELIHVAITGGSASLQDTLSDIVKSSLLTHVQRFLHDISEDAVDSFSFELKNINISGDISCITLSDEVINEITEHIKLLLTKISGCLLEKAVEKGIILSVISITTEIVSPIIGVLITFLPSILNGFFKDWQRKSQEENIHTQLLKNVIPKIKLKIRVELPRILHKEIERIIRGISNKFESKIKEQKSAIEASQYKYKVNIKDIQKNLEQYNILLDNLKKIVNDI